MKIEKREWGTAALIAFGVTLLLQIPYALGYWSARTGTEYSGLLVNLSDVTYYVGIQLGRQGEWLYRIRFTSELHAGAFLYTFYLALGHLARMLNLDAVMMWHLSRAVIGFGMFMVLFGFIAYFIENPKWRLVAFVLALVGAGFDLFHLPFDAVDPASAVPLDLRMPEAHLFFSAFTYPHYSAAIALMLIVFWCALRGVLENAARGKWIAFALGGALANVGVAMVYPFLVLLTASVLGVFYFFLAWRAKKILWRDGVFLVILFLPAAPLLLYYQRVLATNEIIRLWNEQVITYSPNPLHYFLTYGAYLVPALWNLWRARFGEGAEIPHRAFLWIWLAVVAILLYAPLNAQRRFVEGVQVPLAILATMALYETVLPRLAQTRWFQNLARRPNYSVAGLRKLLTVLYVGVVSSASVFVLASAVLTTTVLQTYPFFRAREELAAMDWLSQNVSREAVVFSTYYTGAWLPHRAGTRAYIGQYYETTNFFEKFRATENFFDAQTDDATRREFLRAHEIPYLFYGRAEREAGNFDPSRAAYLQRVFENGDAVIYRVVLP